MDTEYKYDVAISCAEEDIEIAQKISYSLKSRKISYYLYTEHRATHWGENIFKISLDKYGAQAKYVLLLISKVFVEKYWSDVERQIAQTITRIGEAYILPLRLDNTEVKVDGLSENIIFEKWNDNPDEIANLIKQKLSELFSDDKKSSQSSLNVNVSGGNAVITESIQQQNNTFNN